MTAGGGEDGAGDPRVEVGAGDRCDNAPLLIPPDVTCQIAPGARVGGAGSSRLRIGYPPDLTLLSAVSAVRPAASLQGVARAGDVLETEEAGYFRRPFEASAFPGLPSDAIRSRALAVQAPSSVNQSALAASVLAGSGNSSGLGSLDPSFPRAACARYSRAIVRHASVNGFRFSFRTPPRSMGHVPCASPSVVCRNSRSVDIRSANSFGSISSTRSACSRTASSPSRAPRRN